MSNGISERSGEVPRAGELAVTRRTPLASASAPVRNEVAPLPVAPGAVEPSAEGSFANRTLQLWEARSPRALTQEDSRQIVANVTGFFSVLAEWAAVEDGKRTIDDQLTAPASPKDPA